MISQAFSIDFLVLCANAWKPVSCGQTSLTELIMIGKCEQDIKIYVNIFMRWLKCYRFVVDDQVWLVSHLAEHKMVFELNSLKRLCFRSHRDTLTRCVAWNCVYILFDMVALAHSTQRSIWSLWRHNFQFEYYFITVAQRIL